MFRFLLLIFLIMSCVALIKEICHFVKLEMKQPSKITFCKNDHLLAFPRSFLPSNLAHYDVNYLYGYIEQQNILNEWCAHIIDEVFMMCKEKYPVIISIHYFQNRTSNHIPCKILQTKNTIVVVPLSQKEKYYVNDASFIDSSCIFSHPNEPLYIAGKDFLLVTTQKCKAWDL
jgi:hypothetical protein